MTDPASTALLIGLEAAGSFPRMVARIALVLVGFVVLLAVLALFSVAIEGPLRAGVGLVGQYGGPVGILVSMVTLGAAMLWGARRIERQALQRQYAADRTIHVEKPVVYPWTFARIASTVVVGGFFAFVAACAVAVGVRFLLGL